MHTYTRAHGFIDAGQSRGYVASGERAADPGGDGGGCRGRRFHRLALLASRPEKSGGRGLCETSAEALSECAAHPGFSWSWVRGRFPFSMTRATKVVSETRDSRSDEDDISRDTSILLILLFFSLSKISLRGVSDVSIKRCRLLF